MVAWCLEMSPFSHLGGHHLGTGPASPSHSWKVHGAVLTHHPFPCSYVGGDSWKCPLGSWKQWWAELCQGWKTSVMAGGILLSEDSGICSWSGPPVLPCSSLDLYIQMDISFLFSFAFLFSSFLVTSKASSDNHFAFLNFFFLGMVLITAFCRVS